MADTKEQWYDLLKSNVIKMGEYVVSLETELSKEQDEELRKNIKDKISKQQEQIRQYNYYLDKKPKV